MAEESRGSQALGSRARAADWAKWVISAILLLVMTAGYWALSRDHRAKLDEARATAEQQRQTAKLEPKAAVRERAGEPTRREPQVAVQTVALPPMAEPVPPLAAPSAAPTAIDELYAGPICYGPAPGDRPRCFRAQATIIRGKIAGQWPGRDPGVTMIMAGEVSAAGEAKIRVEAQRSDGSRTAAIDLIGTMKDGRLDATGSFHNGRTALLNWRKSAIGSR
jgi:hypothetical protein